MIKKHFKKLVSVALTAVMALGMTTTAFANEKDTLNLDAALMEKGYPQIVLDTMDEDTKMDIYNEGDIAYSIQKFPSKSNHAFTGSPSPHSSKASLCLA